MYNVLIVEDDPMVAMINEQYVNKNKLFTVVGSCRNGQEAVSFLENQKKEAPVHLVILDVYMPYMDGVETLKKIREKNFDVEVIMVTAANDTSTLESTIHLGVIDYLVKPFAYERFQVALEKFDVKKNALKGTTVLNQQNIDNYISNSTSNNQKEYPKGIQEKTLKLILDYFNSCSTWLSGDLIAEKVGLSSVTIRRYMNYLVTSGEVSEDINYETGGRPSILYKRNR